MRKNVCVMLFFYFFHHRYFNGYKKKKKKKKNCRKNETFHTTRTHIDTKELGVFLSRSVLCKVFHVVITGVCMLVVFFLLACSVIAFISVASIVDVVVISLRCFSFLHFTISSFMIICCVFIPAGK